MLMMIGIRPHLPLLGMFQSLVFCFHWLLLL